MDGILIINKEKKYTSNDVVKKTKKILNCNKVGHTGTLDPNATGVLPLLLGNATKISKYIINHDKEYKATLKLGIKTTTADEEGEVLEEVNVDLESLDEDKINSVLKSFIGDYVQIPPMYSAIKIKGKKLYEYARKGEKVEVQPRKVYIYDIDVLKIDKNSKKIEFYVKCSKGTYIRTLCEDIANKLNSVGYMKDLNRISVGEFNIKDSITINEIEKNKFNIITIEEFLIKYPKVIIENNNELTRYLNGVKIKLENKKDGIYRVYYKGRFIGTGILENAQIKRDIVI